MRPLDFLGRIKAKLGIVIVLAVVAAFVVNEVGINSGLSRDLRIAIAVVLALIMVQLLARGMIRPLREMAAAAQTIAKGRYGLRVTATSRDEVGELARAFNAMAADLAEVDRQRRELVANVSHELRTPITGLQAVLENVVDGVTPPDLDTLGTALAQTQRLGRLVAQLLDLSRLDSGARLIDPEELDLASLCRQAVSEAALARDDVTVVSAVAPGTVLSADAALLAQVLANLLDNAVRHSPSGGTVRVGARRAGPNLEISVTDGGPGIPPGERARVFERFSRLDAGRAADAGGAGLGLAIAKEIVELHGGSISVADPIPTVRRAAREDRGGAPGCRMVVVLPSQGEPATGESVDGSVHADERRGTMDVEAGGNHLATRHGGDDAGGGLPRTAEIGSPASAGSGSPGDSATAAGGAGDEDTAAHPGAGHEAGRGAGRGAGREVGQSEAGHLEAGQPEVEHFEVLHEGVHNEGVHNEAGQPEAGQSEAGQSEAGHHEVGEHDPFHDREAGGSVRGDDELREHPRQVDPVRVDVTQGAAPVGGVGPQAQVLSQHPRVYNRAAPSARAALGAGVGMFAGFFAGLFVAFFLGLYFGGILGVGAMLLFTAGGAVVGAALGSSSAQRSALAVTVLPPPEPAEQVPGASVTSASVTSASVHSASVHSASVHSASVHNAPVPGPSISAAAGHAASQPVALEPVASEPVASESVASEPVASGPVTSGPAAAGPSVGHPAGPRGQAYAGQWPVPQEQTAPHGPGRYPPPDYVPPSLFPRPELPDAPRWLLPAAAAAGLVAAVALPYASPGLGLVLTAVAAGAAAFPAVLPLSRGRVTPWTGIFGLLAYALVSVALFRDAEWLVAPVLLAAFGVGSLALSGGGRGWLAVLRGVVSVAIAVLPMPWFLVGPLRGLARRRRMLPTLVGVAVTVVLLGVFGLLFSSADAVFSAFVDDLLRTPEWAQSLPFRIFVFCVFAVLVGAAVLVGLRPVAEPAAPDLRMSLGRQVWVIPLLGLNLLFAAFVTVQITVLFGGSRRVLSTAGLTYAEYARSGFFELVTVSVFVLGVVAAAVALLRRKTRADRWLLAVLLGLLCAFTLVILASALHRLGLYTDAYGLSRLRASVEATIWWLGAVFVLVPAAGAVRLFGGGTSWFFRALVLLTGVSLLAFAVWNPDARVAETQLTIRGVERLDHGYLGDLGAEAVPVLDGLPEPDRSCVLRDVVAVNRLHAPDPWNGWNLARAHAREVLERRPIRQDVDCPGSSRVPGPSD
ncbi:DUF4153 domain-containing protein [Microbispora sp. CA-135349]|uniref:DUF4153 domain-containing protein n=1 Tax=Microbispora sp. CA-135349 TaxID=3239953 RepID=UPI003D923DE9